MNLAVILSFVFLIFPLTITTDKTLTLVNDRKALLTFKSGLTKAGLLDWEEDNKDTCSWVGIKCENVTKDEKYGLVNCTNAWNPGRSIYNDCQIRVITINLPAKGLFGPIIANSIDKLDALTVLNLRSNVLYGSLPPGIFYLPNLNRIILPNNSLCGHLPSFKKPFSPKFKIINLSYNSFTGPIPVLFYTLKGLLDLSLQNNNFTGRILDNLKFNRLCYLNLSNNELEGPIPYSLQKFNFTRESFMGNFGLCGLPLNDCSLLPPPPPPLSDAPILIVSHSVFMAYLLTLLYFPV